MAYKDSSEIATNSNYALGDYSFRIERTSVPGSTNDKIEAICTKDGKNARKSIQVPSSTQLDGWYVEANDTVATIYALIATKGVRRNASPGTVLATLPYPYPTSPGSRTYTLAGENGAYNCGVQQAGDYIGPLVISEKYDDVTTIIVQKNSSGGTSTHTKPADGYVTYEGENYYYNSRYWVYSGERVPTTVTEIVLSILPQIIGKGESEQIMIGRFAIELEDAGGVGPESDWTDPGDYDYDDYPDPDERDPEDPTYTLNLEVVGALSGRHNDPLNDTSYSYTPADKETIKDYGCGGDGGNGGGGGAGASNIVVYKFATSRADSKEIVCKPIRHGYGSGGGKGGKGGDGCILVYY